MPIHDWSRVEAGIFHHFHQAWTIDISNALNAGLLPVAFSALADQHAAGVISDILTLQHRPRSGLPTVSGGNLLTMTVPRTSIVRKTTKEIYAGRGNRIVIRHRLGEIVAVIEIASPGNKECRSAPNAFVEKSIDFLRKGVHQLIVDLFTPSKRDPGGIHKAIGDEIEEELFTLPADKPLTLVSYKAGLEKTAFVEPVGVGDRLPDMPIYLDSESYVMVPLEATYQTTFAACPAIMRELVETGKLEMEDEEEKE